MNIFNPILDLILPRRCILCGIELGSGHPKTRLCTSCGKTLSPFGQLRCAFCGSISQNGRTCAPCRRHHHLDRLLVACNYGRPPIIRIVKECKYRFIEDLARDMARIMIERFGSSTISVDTLIVPVPLHPKRLRWRGFNQAEVIAKTLAKHFKVEVVPSILYRTSLAKPQADILNRYERIKNIAGAFGIRHPEVVAGRPVVLVDDVSTTGATLDACATLLKSAGATDVTAMVFARG